MDDLDRDEQEARLSVLRMALEGEKPRGKAPVVPRSESRQVELEATLKRMFSHEAFVR